MRFNTGLPLIILFTFSCLPAIGQFTFVKQWDHRFGGTDEDDLTSIQQTRDSGYILGGISVTDSNQDVSQHTRGFYDYWVIKVDSAGNKQWDKRYGGSNYDALYALQQTNDGGYIFGGFTNSDSSGDISQ